MNTFYIALSLAALVSVFLCFTTISLFLKTFLCEPFKDPPGKRKIHQRIVPRAGGVSVVLTFLFILFTWHTFFYTYLPRLPENIYTAILFATLSILIVGILDDTYVIEIQNRAKFLLEILIAAEIVLIIGVRIDTINFFSMTIHPGIIAIPLSILWIVGVANAVNIIDGIDGLAGSIVLICIATVGVLAYKAGAVQLLSVCVVITGIVAGFLLHNKPPARVFLGDTGSLFLGMMVGLLSIEIIRIPVKNTHYPIITMILVAGLPIIDVTVAMVRRYYHAIASGIPWYKGIGAMTIADNDHIHHRLIHRGLTHGESTAILIVFEAILCGAALVIVHTGTAQTIFVITYVFVVVGWMLYHLGFLGMGGSRLWNTLTYAKPGLKKYSIAVIHSDEILQHALLSYNQNTFSFVFLSKDQLTADPHQYSSIIVVNTVQDGLINDLELSNQLYAAGSCPVVLISDYIEMIPVQNSGIQIILASRPVYIPALLNELVKVITNRPVITAGKQIRINVTGLHPSLDGTSNVKRS